MVWIGFIGLDLIPDGLAMTTSMNLHGDAFIGVVKTTPI
ncbi:hypothetical protein MGWOODY_XGa1767 [hydrothermal vent metagenome]|uniref:Uncharacterized protein n=1 Tax=hydrothermal vent metagenome TaxID=652676 RepID=A0A160TWD0_9ZZZZ